MSKNPKNTSKVILDGENKKENEEVKNKITEWINKNADKKFGTFIKEKPLQGLKSSDIVKYFKKDNPDYKSDFKDFETCARQAKEKTRENIKNIVMEKLSQGKNEEYIKENVYIGNTSLKHYISGKDLEQFESLHNHSSLESVNEKFKKNYSISENDLDQAKKSHETLNNNQQVQRERENLTPKQKMEKMDIEGDLRCSKLILDQKLQAQSIIKGFENQGKVQTKDNKSPSNICQKRQSQKKLEI